MTDTREPLATVQEAVAPTTAASPKASAKAKETPKENAYAEIRQRAKSSFCFGTDDDVAAPVAAKPAPVMDAEPVDDSIARVDPKTLDMKDLRTACRERGLLVGGGKDALVERISLAIAAGTCAPMPPLNVESSGAAAGSKRSSPCADVTDDGAAVARKIARTQHAGNAIFEDGEKQTLDPAWAPKADAFLGEMLSSPAKKVTVSDAKLRDLGVGRDIFSDAPSPSTAKPTAKGQICERSRLGLQGNDIFADGPAMDTTRRQQPWMNTAVRRRRPRRRRPRGPTSSPTRLRGVIRRRLAKKSASAKSPAPRNSSPPSPSAMNATRLTQVRPMPS